MTWLTVLLEGSRTAILEIGMMTATEDVPRLVSHCASKMTPTQPVFLLLLASAHYRVEWVGLQQRWFVVRRTAWPEFKLFLQVFLKSPSGYGRRQQAKVVSPATSHVNKLIHTQESGPKS